MADTIFSLKEELPGGRPDDSDGAAGSLQPGSLARGRLREICFVVKITPLGALLRVESDFQLGERLELALMSGEVLGGTIEAADGHDVRLRFDQPADVFALIARNLVRQPGDNRRMPRIELRCPTQIRSGSRRDHAMTQDISDGGCCIETNLPLVVHEQVELAMDGFRPIQAVVRWVQGRRAGLAFQPAINWQELMPWLKLRHKRRVPVPTATPVAANEVVQPAARVDDVEAGIALNLAARVRDGNRRWQIEIESIDTHEVRFSSLSPLEPGRLFWISLPGLEGWPARIVGIDGYTVTCAFTQPLHPAVLERVLSQRGCGKAA